MSVIQDLYTLFDKEYARHLASRSTKNLLLLELRCNLAYLREGLAEELDGAAIIAGLDEAQFNRAIEKGLNLDAIQKKRLASSTYGGVKEFEKYRGWSTARLIQKAYERLAILKKLNLNGTAVDVRSRLQYLFKFLMVVMAHIDGIDLRIGRSPSSGRHRHN